MNDALKHPSVAPRVTGDVMASDDNNVKSSLDTSCNCSPVAAEGEPSQAVHTAVVKTRAN